MFKDLPDISRGTANNSEINQTTARHIDEAFSRVLGQAFGPTGDSNPHNETLEINTVNPDRLVRDTQSEEPRHRLQSPLRTPYYPTNTISTK